MSKKDDQQLKNFILDSESMFVANWPKKVEVTGVVGSGFSYADTVDPVTFEAGQCSGKLLLLPVENNDMLQWMAKEWSETTLIGTDECSAIAKLADVDDRSLWIMLDGGEGNFKSADFWGHAKKWLSPGCMVFSFDSIDMNDIATNGSLNGCEFSELVVDALAQSSAKPKLKSLKN